MPLIKLNASLRNTAGIKEARIQGRTIIDVITNLFCEFPDLSEVIIEGDQVRAHFIVTLNGIHTTEFNQTVDENSIISVFPPIAGG